jgi:branched-chain amino acid transport system ATP-binding protein
MLEVKGLSKDFGGLSAVNELDLHINAGELVGLIGPNGAGKTTTFDLLTGFLRPTQGKIIFNGANIVGQKPHSIAKKGIVRTFQATSLFPDFAVMKNILAASHLKTKVGFWKSIFRIFSNRGIKEINFNRALEILQFLGLEDVKDMPARSLPHGYKRILGIAIALAAEPKLLLLDEPLSGMNAGEVTEAMAFINKIWQRGATILLIEHNMRAAMSLCERIIVLNFGRKIAEGLPEEIKEKKEVIQAYLGEEGYVAQP